MNNGAFGENFPYSNFHDLNMDWIIKIAKDFSDQYTHIQQVIEDGETQLQNLTEEEKQELEEKATELTALLNEWYNTHSEDITNELTNAVQELNEWYNNHVGYLDDELARNIREFETSADQKASETIESIPSDYSNFYSEFKDLEKHNAYNMFFNNLTMSSGTHNGITYAWNNNTCTANGTSTGTSVNILYNDVLPVGFVPNENIYIDFHTTSSALNLRIIFQDSQNVILATYVIGAPRIMKIPANATRLNMALYVVTGNTLNNAQATLPIALNTLSNYILFSHSLMEHNFALAGYPSIYDIPFSYWQYHNGTEFTGLLGESFPYDLRPTMGYVLTAKKFLGQCFMFELRSTDLKEQYIGATSLANPREPSWYALDPLISIHDIDTTEADSNIVAQIYTDFEHLPGWYWEDGTLINTTGTLIHSQMLEVIPNKDYYMSAYWDHSIWGYFFDKYKKPIAPLRTAQIEEYQYQNANADPDTQTDSTFTYAKLYKFTTPENARYFSYNLYPEVESGSAPHSYRLYIASIPVFRATNTGNLILRKTDPLYQRFGNRRLCIIGPSNVMIDRLQRTGNFLNNGSNQTQFVSGFQEYLMPYWKSVTSFGFSGASYGKLDTGVTHPSIYTRICEQEVLDLTPFDDYILVGNQNQMTRTGAGHVDNWSDLGDETTYIGAVRHIMDYIYRHNPDAKIYNCTMYYIEADFTTPSRMDIIDSVDAELEKISKYCSAPIIHHRTDSGMNYTTNSRWTYDGTHANQIGSRMVGEATLKELL